MDDREYIDGMIGVYEFNSVSLLRQIYVVVRAELDALEPPALTYREFDRDAVRRNVLEWRRFHRSRTLAMAREAGIPNADHDQVADYVANEIGGLHEGNAIRYRLTNDDLTPMGTGRQL